MHPIVYIAGGLFVGFIIGLVSNGVFWPAVIILICVVFAIGCADWSGQGDGREGCNRHTSCNH